MNLPPVPGTSLPPPPGGQPAATPPSPAAPGSKARLILSLSLVAVGLLLAVTALLRPQPPDESAVESFVRKRLSAECANVQNVWIASHTSAGGTETFGVNVEASKPQEALYAPLFSEGRNAEETPSLPDWLNLDPKELQRCRRMLAGPFGARLCQLAGIEAKDEALLRTTVLRQVRSGSESHDTVSGTVTAERHGLRWQLAWTPPAAAPAQPRMDAEEAGRPLGAFAGPVCVIDRPADKERLLALAGRIPLIHDRFDKAVPALLSEIKPTLLTVLKPGAFFAGTATGHESINTIQTRVFVDITEVRDEGSAVKLTALLRNDGRWDDVRMFSGTVAMGEEGAFAIVLTPAQTEESDELAGPFLNDHADGFDLTDSEGNTILPLTIQGHTLSWTTAAISLRLEQGTTETRAAVIAELQAQQAKYVAAVQQNRTYVGTVTDRLTGNVGKWKLRFESFDPGDQKVTATLETSDPSPWSTTLSGKLETNRYRSEAGSVSFESFADPVPTWLRPTWREIWPLVLSIDGDTLHAQKQRYILHFDRSDEAKPSAPQ